MFTVSNTSTNNINIIFDKLQRVECVRGCKFMFSFSKGTTHLRVSFPELTTLRV